LNRIAARRDFDENLATKQAVVPAQNSGWALTGLSNMVMPEISRFFGIIIYMYAKDQLPPHFHADYNDDEAMFSIETGNIIQGDLPRKQA